MRKKATTKPWTDADLREFFDLANSRYFGGRLKALRIRFASLDGLGNTHRAAYRVLYGPRSQYRPVDRIEYHITISHRLRYSRRLWATTLLHEMVHLEGENRNSCGLRGHRFNRRMKELAVAGAFNGLW